MMISPGTDLDQLPLTVQSSFEIFS